MQQQYLKDISKYPILTVEQEKKYILQAKAGNIAARDKLVTSNLRFVLQIANFYEGKGVDVDDLIQDGNLGLIKAIERFDPTKGFRLTTYASWWIKQKILQTLSEHRDIIRVPASRTNILSKINKAKETLRHKLSREPYESEVEEYLDGIDVEKALRNTSKSLKLNAYNQYDQEIISFIEQTSEDNIDATRVEDIKKEIDSLTKGFPERERAVLELYFGLGGTKPFTLEEIGNLFQISRERIRQIKEKVLTKLSESPEIKKLRPYL